MSNLGGLGLPQAIGRGLAATVAPAPHPLGHIDRAILSQTDCGDRHSLKDRTDDLLAAHGWASTTNPSQPTYS